MGTADIVPGGGGTIAFITGIYSSLSQQLQASVMLLLQIYSSLGLSRLGRNTTKL